MSLTAELIKPESLGYSDIYLDFLAGSDPASGFYIQTDLKKVAERLDAVSFDRDKLADILKAQNERYGVSQPALDNIEKLRDPKAVCVFSGQQAGLFGGPMYSIIKGLAITKAATQYADELGRPVIPIFWIAGDDHDFEEVNNAAILDRGGEIVELKYDAPPKLEVPTSEITFENADELERVKNELKEALGETDFTPELYELLDQAYTSEDTFVTAFGKFMAGLTKDLGLVFFSPGDPAAKKHAIPFFKTIVEKQNEMHSRIESRNKEIEKSGYHIQVEKKDNATHLFYNLNGRKPVMRNGDSFTVGDKSFSREELLERIESEPEKFSPDVMTRPSLQSWLFPTISQKGGPAEIAYLAQINPVFELFDIPAPVHRARPTLTVVEARHEKLMKKEDITFEELTGDIEQVINRVLEKTFPDDLDQEFDQLKRHIKTHVEDFAQDSLEFDPSLRKFAKQIAGKIDYQLKQLEGKVFSSHKKKSKQSRDRIYRLWHALYPNRTLQERVLNISYFISKYDFGIVKYIYDEMDSEEKSHQLISLSEYQP